MNPHDDFIKLLTVAMAAPGFWQFLQWIVGKITGKVSVEKQLEQIRSDMDHEDKLRQMDNAKATRRRILRFSDELRNNMRHSENMFNDALDDCSYYERYCRHNPDFPNERANEAISNIKDKYRKCMEDHDFL